MALSKRARFLATCALVLVSAWISSRYERSASFERPLHAVIVILLESAGLLFAAGVALSNPEERRTGILSVLVNGRRPVNVPLVAEDPKALDASLVTSVGEKYGLPVLMVTCVVGRASILQWIVRNVECSQEAVTLSCLPVLLALVDVLYAQWRSKTTASQGTVKNPDLEARYTQSRYLLPMLLISTGIFVSRSSFTRSTYICPVASWYPLAIPLLQYLGVVLDTIIIAYSIKVLADCHTFTDRLFGISDVLILSGYALGLLGSIIISIHQEWKAWALSCSWGFIGNVLLDGFLLSLFLISVCLLWSELSPIPIFVIAIFSSISYWQVTATWTSSFEFLPTPSWLSILSTILIVGGTIYTFNVESHVETGKSTGSTKNERQIWTVLVLLVGIVALLQVNTNAGIVVHTIETLMQNAKLQHAQWAQQASSSATLEAAVKAYRTRYQRHPPPHFDKWFEFATIRNAVVIDDFDRIWEDLQPFMTVEPSVLRNATNDMLSNQWNEIAGLSIRNGTMIVSPHIVGTHRWMLDGITGMVQNFVEWLPDMDIGFNINDECRVIVPWEDMEPRRRQQVKVGTEAKPGQNPDFSDTFSQFGQPVWMNESAVLPYGPTKLFPDHSFTQTFRHHGATSCPPDSPARNIYHWNRRSHCASCAAPYSSGHFLQNWTLSNNICSQPDMANLHGFHLSPSAFKTSRHLLPVFSQSKVHGYNDILYPSPWNYADKVSYNPEHDIAFADKENTLFWRGSTSEGFSLYDTWRGMQRQRFVHLANNSTSSTLIPILLPSSSSSSMINKKYTYQHLPISQVSAQLPISASMVDHIQRCSTPDCDKQATELGLSPPSDFQEHWKYRYLADFDGAGFSGRFLPFLSSGSVPFKAALFREWYDDRIVPWLHFVPLDSRLQGIYSTLAYFAGWDWGDERGGHGEEKNRHKHHDAKGPGAAGAAAAAAAAANKGIGRGERIKEGEWIARQGSEWAKKVLRKEDMEIYFFRLLLEWGRIIDDRRDEIGFVL